jgi:hypothetical protein
MIRLLKNISVHLWLTVLVSIPVVFGVLVLFESVFWGADPVVVLLVVFITAFAGIGLVLDFSAKKIIRHLIDEGQTWERSGLDAKAEKAYRRAVRIYDTFLLRPFLNQEITALICGAVARFQVGTAREHQAFELGVTRYLKFNPGDEDVVLPWLKQLRSRDAITSGEQETLTRLARYHYDHPLISDTLTDIFLRLERKDFHARKLYRHAAQTPAYQSRIEALIGRQGHPEPETVATTGPMTKIRVKKKIRITQMVAAAAARLGSAAKAMVVFSGSVLSGVLLAAARIFEWLKTSQRARFYLKTGAMSLVCIWLVIFMFSTVTHIFKSRAVKQDGLKQMEIQVPKPFTIQVAAYLKQKHADRYVAQLRKKDIDAHVKKAAGGGKTWYLVRVSEFVDKQSATEYGKKLKEQNIIDDFFVNNK